MNPPTFPILPSALWIWPTVHHFDIHNDYALFRKRIVLDAKPTHAPTLITADQSYQLHVNGHYVCRGPARGYQHSWPCDEIDLSPYLRAGENVVAVRAHNPGFSTFQYLSQGWAGFLFMGRWGTHEIVSDTTWKTRRQSGLKRDTPPSSFQLFCQEHVDARLEADDWADPGFDDADWGVPFANRAWNSPPWHDLEARGVPMLHEETIIPLRLLGSATGLSSPGADTARNVVEPCRNEPLGHASLPDGDPERIVVPASDSEAYSSFLLDFEKTRIGNLTLHVEGAAGGEIVDAVFVETLDQATLAPHLHQLQVSLGSRLVCRAGTTRHTFYHPYGFRYLMLRVRNATVPLLVRPSLTQIGYPLGDAGRFSSSDAGLQKIWEACAWTQRVCSLDAYVDTPWREQAQWWGDARVQAWNTFHLDDDARLLRRGIASIAGQTTPDGLTYGHAPTVAHHCVLPDFTLIWILTLWDHYWQTGSLEAFHSHRDTLRRALDYFRSHTDPANGLVGKDPRHWLFLDWADLFQEGYPTVLNLWLLLALRKTERLALLAGDAPLAGELAAWSATLSSTLRGLVDADGLLHDGKTWDGNLVPDRSIHSQTLGLMTGLLDAATALPPLLRFVRGEETPKAKPSGYWRTYLFSVLDAAEHGGAVVDHIETAWKEMAEHGTTWSQLKEYGGDHSHSHAWSAHPLYHLMQIVGGLRQREAAWREIEFRPLFRGDSASCRIPTPHGFLASSWERKDDRYRVTLTVPPGVVARVVLPGIGEERSAGTHSWTVPATA